MTVRPRMLPLGDPRHGRNGYSNYGCPCDICREANRAAQAKYRAVIRSRPIPPHVHGTPNGRNNYGCDCRDCRNAAYLAHRSRYTPSPRWGLEHAKTRDMYADYTAGMTIREVTEKWGTTVSAVYNRFYRAGLPLTHSAGKTAAMYIDYCTGMTVAEVAAKWGAAPNSVYERFRSAKLPLRPRQGSAKPRVRIRSGVPFELANGVRASTAGHRRAEAAQAALPHVTDSWQRQVLELRIADPDASLAVLAARCTPPVTKDSYASHLRRALLKAGSETQ